MLYLRTLSDDAGPSQVPVADRTAEALEQALLAIDTGECERILAAAFEHDPAFGEWSRREARNAAHAGRWWSDQLATKLAERIEPVDASADASSVERRLPALVRKLCDCEQRLNAFDRQLEHEKLEALKELAYGAGHEINNPLANIAARAQTLLAEEPNPERQRKLSAIHRQAMRAHEMIADLMLFARPPKMVAAECDLADIVRQVAGEFAERAAERSIALTCDVGPSPIVVNADATQIAVAISAVISNAIEAVGTNGHVAVAAQAHRYPFPEGKGLEPWAEVVVCDDGPGISAEVRRHLFDPFYSGREAGRGLGFGLSKCWRIVTDHRGRIVVNNAATGGAEFTIALPLISKSH